MASSCAKDNLGIKESFGWVWLSVKGSDSRVPNGTYHMVRENPPLIKADFGQRWSVPKKRFDPYFTPIESPSQGFLICITEKPQVRNQKLKVTLKSIIQVEKAFIIFLTF